MTVIVIWQSLVVSAYRSFWIHFSRAVKGSVTAVVPHEFWELGGQMVSCEPFSEEWNRAIETHVLKVRAPHIQAVWFHGLARVFRAVCRKANSSRLHDKPVVLVALMEPYSLSALFVYLWAKVFLPHRTEILFYSLQNIYKEFPLPLRLIQKFIFKKTRRILAISSEVTEVLRRQGYEGKIIRFPLWADSSLFNFQNVSPEECASHPHSSAAALLRTDFRRVHLGFCGAVTEPKGVPDLLAALELLADEELAQIHFEIAGGGAVLASAESRLTALGDRGLTFKLHGPIPASVLPDFFRALDVLVVPSRTEPHWKEQFGRVIVEAWACGVTVIGSNSGEIPVLLSTPECIFQERNPESLVSVLRRVLNREHTFASRQQNALKARPYLDVTLAKQFARELIGLADSN